MKIDNRTRNALTALAVALVALGLIALLAQKPTETSETPETSTSSEAAPEPGSSDEFTTELDKQISAFLGDTGAGDYLLDVRGDDYRRQTLYRAVGGYEEKMKDTRGGANVHTSTVCISSSPDVLTCDISDAKAGVQNTGVQLPAQDDPADTSLRQWQTAAVAAVRGATSAAGEDDAKYKVTEDGSTVTLSATTGTGPNAFTEQWTFTPTTVTLTVSGDMNGGEVPEGAVTVTATKGPTGSLKSPVPAAQ